MLLNPHGLVFCGTKHLVKLIMFLKMNPWKNIIISYENWKVESGLASAVYVVQ